MKIKEFTFIKLSTGGKLIIKAESEKEARGRMKLSTDDWELEKEDKIASTSSNSHGETEPDSV